MHLSKCTRHYTKIAPRSPFFRLLKQLETLNYLLLEVINGIRLDFDSRVFAFITYLNFPLENEIGPFKASLMGLLTKSAPSPQTCSLIFELDFSLSRDLPH